MIKKENGIEYEVIKAKKHSTLNLLFVHGTGCNKKFLRALAVLFEDYNCYLIDLPGHGNSDNTGYNFDNYIRAIRKLVQKLSNVVIIGHSLGGTLVIKTASLNLKQIIGVVILDGSSSWPECDKEAMKMAHEGVARSNWLMGALGHEDNQDVKDAVSTMEPDGNIIADLFIDEVINIDDCLKKIRIPALIIDGEDDPIALVKYQEKLNREIKNSKLVILPKGKHMVCIAEKYKVKDLVCDFITKSILKDRKYELI